jgi:hypothetical protein
MGSRILFPSGAGLICMGENQPCTLPGDEIQKHYEDHFRLFKKRALLRKASFLMGFMQLIKSLIFTLVILIDKESKDRGLFYLWKE